jgi:two-component sensor histidine kinase
MNREILNKYIILPRHSESLVIAPALLLAESNHRIANNLSLVSSMLNMKAREIVHGDQPLEPNEAYELLIEAGSNIQVIADLHRLLSAHGNSLVDLQVYLEQIGRGVIEAMSHNHDVAFVVELDGGCRCTADRASHLGLIVNELLINALKYAHPAQNVRGRIELGCCQDDEGTLTVWVADDGVGLPEGFDPARDTGLGMRTLRAIAKKIGAEVDFDSTSLGLTATIVLPPE